MLVLSYKNNGRPKNPARMRVKAELLRHWETSKSKKVGMINLKNIDVNQQ